MPSGSEPVRSHLGRSVDARHRQLTGAEVAEPVSCPRGSHHNVADIRGQAPVVQLEGRLPGMDDEYLRVWMAMELRPVPGLVVNEEHRNRHVTVLAAVEHIRKLASRQGSVWDQVRHEGSVRTLSCL